MVRIILPLLIIFLLPLNALACSCEVAQNDSFSQTTKSSEFVALVKVVSFDEFLEHKIIGHKGKMPYVMTVEIIKKYKGKEDRKTIKIIGDNGSLCRPYLSKFKLNGYYLIAPNALKNTEKADYDFFSCRTEYLKVDMKSNIAHGKYTLKSDQIDLASFEGKMKDGN